MTDPMRVEKAARACSKMVTNMVPYYEMSNTIVKENLH